MSDAGFCTNCGEPRQPGTRFCGKCGTKFEEPTAQPASAPSAVQPQGAILASAPPVLRPMVIEPEGYALGSGALGALVGALVAALVSHLQLGGPPVGNSVAYIFDALIGAIVGAWVVIFAGRRSTRLAIIAGVAAVVGIVAQDVLNLTRGVFEFQLGRYLEFIGANLIGYAVALVIAALAAAAIAWDGWRRVLG